MGKRHGESSGRLYGVWNSMIGRCTRPKTRQFERYGGRGITVCSEWRDPGVFTAWARANGYRDGLQIDRIDNDGHYEPGNCRFVTAKTNGRNRCDNRLITFNGITKPLAAWAEEAGLHPKTVSTRIDKYGWTLSQALTLPLRRGKKP
jgi:hypothetical protein